MKKIYQQTSKDCIRATFASIFELELEEVPDFNLELPEGDSEELNKRINAWLQVVTNQLKQLVLGTVGRMKLEE